MTHATEVHSCLLGIVALALLIPACSFGGGAEGEALMRVGHEAFAACMPDASGDDCFDADLHADLTKLGDDPKLGAYASFELTRMSGASSYPGEHRGRVTGRILYAERFAFLTIDFVERDDAWTATAWTAGELAEVTPASDAWMSSRWNQTFTRSD